MTDDQCTWHPEGKWSAADILEHLSLAYSRTTDRMKPLLKQQSLPARRRTAREWIARFIVLNLKFIPTGRKAPEILLPRGIGAIEARIAAAEKLRDFNTILDQCERQFGSKTKIMDNNFLGPLSASEWRKFHCLHTLHHMKQIKALRERMGVSGSSSSAVRA